MFLEISLLCFFGTSLLTEIDEGYYDPHTKEEISKEDILSYQTAVNVFSSKGIALTHHMVNLSVTMQIFQNISDNLDTLLSKDPTNPHARKAIKNRDKVNQLHRSLCHFGDTVEKRFILEVAVVAFLTSVFTGTGTSLGIAAGLGLFRDQQLTKQEIRLHEDKDRKSKERDTYFRERIKELSVSSKDLADQLDFQDYSKIIELDFQSVLEYFELVVSFENYHFTESKLLDNIQNKLVKNENYSKLANGAQFGLSGKITLLSLSESESLLLSDDEKHQCDTSAILMKIRTVIPDESFQVSPTEQKYKYKLNSERSVYMNPKFILNKSRFRPQSTFSKMRRIVGLDSRISMVIPFNNTYLFIQTEGGFLVKKTCGEQAKVFRLFRNPYLKVPEHCSIESPYLNVSDFKVIYTMAELEPVIEVHNINDTDFSPLYSVDESVELKDYMLEKQIEEIYTIKKHITQLHKEAIANSDWFEKVGEGFVRLGHGIQSLCTGAIQSFLLDPFYKVVAGIILLLILLCLALWLRRKRSK